MRVRGCIRAARVDVGDRGACCSTPVSFLGGSSVVTLCSTLNSLNFTSQTDCTFAVRRVFVTKGNQSRSPLLPYAMHFLRRDLLHPIHVLLQLWTHWSAVSHVPYRDHVIPWKCLRLVEHASFFVLPPQFFKLVYSGNPGCLSFKSAACPVLLLFFHLYF